MSNYNFAAKRQTSAKDRDPKIRMAISAPPGGGKTFTLLKTAFALMRHKPNPRILVGDTQNCAASKYANDFPPFDVIGLDDDHGPQCMKALIEYAESEGYDVLIIDSTSHEWSGKNGVLEQVDLLTARTGKSQEAWRQITPAHDAFFQKITDSKLHVFCAFRTKMQVVVERDERGKTVVRRIGMQAITREGSDYEFDVAARMEPDGNVLFIEKTHIPALNGKVFRAPDTEVADILLAWINAGGQPVKQAVVQPTPPPPPAPKAAPAEPAGGSKPAAAPATVAPSTGGNRGKAPVQTVVKPPASPSGEPTDERVILLAQFKTLVGGEDEIVNHILTEARVPYLSRGETWEDLTLDSLKTLLARGPDLTAKIAEVKSKRKPVAATV